jgi:hypothetical protein
MAAYDTTNLDAAYSNGLRSKWFTRQQTSEGWGTTPSMGGGGTTNYFQRVYDTGTVGWCYYTKSTIDATPDAVDTTPNWSGTISDHSIIKRITS